MTTIRIVAAEAASPPPIAVYRRQSPELAALLALAPGDALRLGNLDDDQRHDVRRVLANAARRHGIRIQTWTELPRADDESTTPVLVIRRGRLGEQLESIRHD